LGAVKPEQNFLGVIIQTNGVPFCTLFALFVVALSACVMGLGLLAVVAIFGRGNLKEIEEPPRRQPRRRI
jgi:hypothetical protein